MPDSFIDIVFDGPPGPEGPRFIESEDERGHSISVGEWVHRDDGCWALRIARPFQHVAKLEKALVAMAAYLPPPDVTDAAGVRRAFHDPNAAETLLLMRDAFNEAMKSNA